MDFKKQYLQTMKLAVKAMSDVLLTLPINQKDLDAKTKVLASLKNALEEYTNSLPNITGVQ